MEEFDIKKKKLLNNLFFEAGAALMDCQSLEYSVALFLYNLSRTGMCKIDLDQISLILDNKDKKTLGRLIELIKNNLEIDNNIEKILQSALLARNILVHRILIDNVELFMEEKTRINLIKKIRNLRKSVQHGINILDPFITTCIKNMDGLDLEKYSDWIKSNFN